MKAELIGKRIRLVPSTKEEVDVLNAWVSAVQSAISPDIEKILSEYISASPECFRQKENKKRLFKEITINVKITGIPREIVVC